MSEVEGIRVVWRRVVAPRAAGVQRERRVVPRPRPPAVPGEVARIAPFGQVAVAVVADVAGDDVDPADVAAARPGRRAVVTPDLIERGSRFTRQHPVVEVAPRDQRMWPRDLVPPR